MARLRYMRNARTGDEGTVCIGDLHITGGITVDGSYDYGSGSLPLSQSLQGTLTVGVNDTGYDVLFYGAGSTYQWLWDESANGIVMKGTTSHTGNLTMKGTSKLYFHDAGGEYIYASADNALAIYSGSTITLTSTTIVIAGAITSTGKMTFTPVTTGTFLDFELEDWGYGTLINANFGGSETLDSDTIGILLDFNANVTMTYDKDVTGMELKLPPLSTGQNVTTNIIGYDISLSGALNQSSTGAIIWKGLNVVLPDQQESTGTATAYGVYVAGGTVTSGKQYGIYVTGSNKLTSGIYTTISDPTIATRGIYIYIDAGGSTGWTSGNTCGIRSYVETTCTGTINDFTAGWFGLKFDTGFTAAGTGMVCAINAEVVSIVARAAKAVLVLQSVPAHSTTDFSAMSYIYCGEVLSDSATGSKLLLETDSVESGSQGDLLYNDTIRVKLNGSVRFIPVSTAEGTYTTSYPIVASQDTGATDYVNGIFETLTVDDTCTGTVSALRVLAVCDGSASSVHNYFGANVAARLVHASDVATGMMAGLQVGLDMGAATTQNMWAYGINIDLSEAITRATIPKAFIDFQDYSSGDDYRCPNLFDIGGGGSKCSTGTSGDLHYNDTLKIIVNTTAKYIPLSSEEGTYTSAYPVVLTNATAVDITSTIIAASTYPFSVDATLATNKSTGGMVAAYFNATLSAGTELTTTAGYRTIRSILNIEGSATILSSEACFSAVEGRYYTDGAAVAVSDGIHCALAGLMKAGDNYVISAGAEYCGLAILDSTHNGATIAVDKYSGIFIGNVAGPGKMGNAIKVGSRVTNFLEILDDDAIASLDANSKSESEDPDGWVRISIGGQPCYIYTYMYV